jgi:phosphohistidine phosphatase SixA
MLSMLQETPAHVQRVWMVAHNPGTHHLAHILADDVSLDTHDALHHKYPTGTLCVFCVPEEIKSWKEISPAALTLEAMVMPKKLSV